MQVSDFILGFTGLKKLKSRDLKSAAEWGFILSTLFIVPLFFLPDASVLFKIGMQLVWASWVARAAFLANGVWKKKRPDK